MKKSFLNDYSDGGHPSVLDALRAAQGGVHAGYGLDEHTKNAVGLLQGKLQGESDIHFVTGGTQANLVVLASILRPYEAVIAAATSHINVHEAGAIEATGHKVIQLPSDDGKIHPEQIVEVVHASTEHTAMPRAVFISNATELGTVYTKEELMLLSQCCREHKLFLYLDGARLGSALCSERCGLSLPDLTTFTDVFYIGTEKNGGLCGEAIVINTPELREGFRRHLKQRGALLAKGWVLGLQFHALFREDLWFQLARDANARAHSLREGLVQLGVRFLVDSPSNQLFPIFKNSLIKELEMKWDFYVWRGVTHETSAIRLVTSWATTQQMVDEFVAEVEAKLGGSPAADPIPH